MDNSSYKNVLSNCHSNNVMLDTALFPTYGIQVTKLAHHEGEDIVLNGSCAKKRMYFYREDAIRFMP